MSQLCHFVANDFGSAVYIFLTKKKKSAVIKIHYSRYQRLVKIEVQNQRGCRKFARGEGSIKLYLVVNINSAKATRYGTTDWERERES